MTLGRQGDELLAQLRELLFLPSSSMSAPVKVESGGGQPLGTGPPASSCDRRGSKRGRDDDSKTNNGEQQHGQDEPTARCSSGAKRSCSSRKQKQQKSSRSLVTPEPEFDGYQWRKYGQKQIEGAMYARSYYRCTRNAEQGCLAKRTVQRNDGADEAAPMYTVVYMGEHTCTANDESQEAPPVILETAAVVHAAATRATASTTATATGIESPAISDDVTWSSSGSSDGYGGLFDVHDSGWASGSLEDLVAGPIRSPVHVPEAGWSFDQLLLQIANGPSLTY